MKMLRSRHRFPVPPFQGSYRSMPASQGSRPGLCCSTPSGFCNRDPWDFHGRARHSPKRAEQHSPGRKPWVWGPEIASPERAAQKRLNRLAPHGVIFEAEGAGQGCSKASACQPVHWICVHLRASAVAFVGFVVPKASRVVRFRVCVFSKRSITMAALTDWCIFSQPTPDIFLRPSTDACPFLSRSQPDPDEPT